MFPDPSIEDRRAAAALSMDINLDRRSTADLAIVTTISAIYFIDLLAVLFMLWNRRYPPIKAKSPILMACLFLSSALWFVGDVQMNGHVTLANTALTKCLGLGFWVRILLGICGVCAVFALRSFALYHVFCLNQPYRGVKVYWPVIVYSACILAYGVVALVLKSEKTLYYVGPLDICSSAVGFKASVIGFVWITLAFVAFNYWRIRHIKSSFNESKEMGGACLLIFITTLYSTLVQFLYPRFPLSMAYRVSLTVLSHLCTNVIWWGTMFVPLWGCLFNRRVYLDQWIEKLRRDGLQRKYHLESTSLVRGEFTPADIAMNEAVMREYVYKGPDTYAFYYDGEGGGQRDMAVEGDVSVRALNWMQARNSKDVGFGNDRFLL
ncbi:hypothetical protein IWW37_005120 [Coemansia sp. RSA 2050]|nr:hypothetical protein IWW37_005120 [Coemansia sp. RSA 2050]